MQLGLYSEQSITRRINRENVLLLGGGRALLMQLAHPSVAAGVDDHSDFRTHPVRRLRRTIRMTMAIVFGDRDTAMAAARAVNRVHAHVRGDDYQALDPGLLLWVHATLVDSALVTYSTFVQPLTDRERQLYHLLAEGQSNKEIAARLGLSLHTVETHRTRIMEKLGVHSIAELVLGAVRRGLIV